MIGWPRNYLAIHEEITVSDLQNPKHAFVSWDERLTRGKLNKWMDFAGNNGDCVAPSSQYQPTLVDGDEIYVDFENADRRLVLPTDTANLFRNKSFSLYTRIKIGGIPKNLRETIFSGGNEGINTGILFDIPFSLGNSIEYLQTGAIPTHLPIALNQWTDIAVSLNKDTKTVKLYVNKTSKTESTQGIPNIGVGQAPTLGVATFSSFTKTANYKINRFCIYDRAITDDEYNKLLELPFR